MIEGFNLYWYPLKIKVVYWHGYNYNVPVLCFRALQELLIRFRPESTAPPAATPSVSTISHDDTGKPGLHSLTTLLSSQMIRSYCHPFVIMLLILFLYIYMIYFITNNFHQVLILFIIFSFLNSLFFTFVSYQCFPNHSCFSFPIKDGRRRVKSALVDLC